MYSIVLPIKVSSGRGYQLFCDFGLKSYEKYLDITKLDKFYIIAPSQDIPHIEKFTNTSKIPFQYIPEEEILETGVELEGWFKQQLIKLKMANCVETEGYLVIDSDMYLTQPLFFEDLYHNGKLKYNSEPWQTENNKHYSQNSKWWDASCNVMDYPMEKLHSEKHLMSVTPEFLITSVVKDLMNHLDGIHGEQWQSLIFERGCTEFTMYWLFLLKNNLNNLYTDEGFPLWKHSLEHSVLDYSNATTQVVRNSFTHPQSYFAVIQGYLHIDVTPLIQEGVRCLNRPDIDAVIITAAMLAPQRHQFFSIEDRHKQALETCYSARKYIPSSVCVFVDGSHISPEFQKDYTDTYDHVLLPAGDPDVDTQVHHPMHIGFGECKLLHVAIQHVKENILPYYNPKFIIKLGGRYTLTEKFDLTNFDPTLFNFCKRYDESVDRDVFITKLYSVPPRYLHIFEKMMSEAPENLTNKYTMVESLYREEIPDELVNNVNTLGICGRLSYNGNYFHD
jgi:hypothetical protein